MEEIKNIIDDLAIEAFETSTGIAGVAVMAESGSLIYQTSNFDISKQTNVILSVLNGESSFTLSSLPFSVVERKQEGIIATNPGGMGHGIFVPFEGGVLVAYAMPQADTSKAFAMLRKYSILLNGRV